MERPCIKERIYWHNPVSGMIASFKVKNISEDGFYEKLGGAFSAHELLNCRLKETEDGFLSYESAEGLSPETGTFEGSWQEEALRQLRVPFEPENGKLMRVLLKKEPDGLRVLIVMDHMTGDGVSLMYFIRDIFENTENRKIQARLYNFAQTPKEARLPVSVKLLGFSMNMQWSKTGKVFSREDYRDLCEKYWEERENVLETASVKPERLSKLREKCAAHNIPVSTALTCALYEAFGDKKNLGLAASVRPQGYEGMANLSTGISVEYSYPEGSDFWKNAETVGKLIDKKKNSPKDKYFLLNFIEKFAPTLIDSAFYSAYSDYDNQMSSKAAEIFGYRKEPGGISLMNLPKAPFSGEELGISEMYFCAPLVPSAKCLFSSVTLDDSLSITCQYRKKDTECAGLLDKVMDILNRV